MVFSIRHSIYVAAPLCAAPLCAATLCAATLCAATLCAVIFGLWSVNAWASDPLSAVHAHLDTSDQCGKCHGDDINVADPFKCRDCHREIDRRIRSSRGYHGKIKGDVNCNLCHREHLGRKYQIVRLDLKSFNHNMTGWPLSGKHARTKCRQCHTNKRKSGRDSYLDTSPDCAQCHGQFHGQGVVARLDRCDGCHNAFGWRQLNARVAFDHQRNSRYPLTGKHKTEVECLECHIERTPAGKLKAFGPIDVSGCESCHKDPHPRGIFQGITCAECHTTKTFKDTRSFNHKSTGWALKGAHRKQKCLECHSWKQWAPPSNDCKSCHQDSHNGQFGSTPCQRCHQESSFKKLIFNHNSHSRFPLKGKHKRVNCAKCHPQGKYKPLEMECSSCHESDSPHGDTFGDAECSQCHSPIGWKQTHFDHSVTRFALEGRHEDQPCYRCHPSGTETQDDTEQACSFCHTSTIHKGQFNDRDCLACHVGAERWSIPFFDHSQSRFSLNGAHLSVACDGCHKEGHYKPIDVNCANCHQNFHEGQINQACDQCHFTEGWANLPFDHQRQTQYPLEGLHREIECKKCHLKNQYKGLDQECQTCHLDIHQGSKGAECAQCHTLNGWETNQEINHNFGPFKLGGAHDVLPCERCHGPDRQKSLSGTGPECVSCHRDPHFGSLGPLCQDCHSQNAFLPSTFMHNQTGFRLSGAHRFVECRACHPGRVFGGLPKDCSFCHTDTFQSTSGGRCDHPANCPNAINRCQECHTSTSFQRARPGAQCGVTCQTGGSR